jgi:VanZ family protein
VRLIEDVERKIEPPSSLRDKLRYWLPPILWVAAIFFFSTDRFSGQNTGTILRSLVALLTGELTAEQFGWIHFLIRKAAHFTEYGILAWLLFRAFRFGARTGWSWSWILYPQLIIVIYALLDELHQAFTMTRGSSIYDSLIDICGGFTVLLWIWLTSRRRAG